MDAKQRLSRKVEEIEEEYEIDTTEFGKVFFIASAALFVVSAQSALIMNQTESRLEQVNEDFEEAYLIMNQTDLEQSVNDLRNLKGSFEGSNVAPSFLQAFRAFNSSRDSISTLRQAEKEVESATNIYKWLVLISIIGMVVAAGTIYI